MLLSFLLASIAPLPMQETAPAPTLPRWQIVGSDERGEYAIDPQTVKRTGDRVRAYIRLSLKGDDPVTGVLRYVYDCKANTVRIEQTDVFDTDGSLRGSFPVALAEQTDEPVAPDSPNSAVAARVCK